MSIKLNTFKTAYVSDLHVTTKDRERLDNGTCNYPVAERETGWVITESEYTLEESDEPMSDAFLNLMQLTRDAGCEYLELCRYASPTEGLPRFD